MFPRLRFETALVPAVRSGAVDSHLPTRPPTKLPPLSTFFFCVITHSFKPRQSSNPVNPPTVDPRHPIGQGLPPKSDDASVLSWLGYRQGRPRLAVWGSDKLKGKLISSSKTIPCSPPAREHSLRRGRGLGSSGRGRVGCRLSHAVAWVDCSVGPRRWVLNTEHSRPAADQCERG